MLDQYLPPTDSLYKFIAVSGLLLFCLSFFPTYLSFQVSLQIFELNKEVKIFSERQSQIDSKYENWKKNIEAIDQKIEEQKRQLNNEIAKNIEQINKGDKSSLKKLVEMSLKIENSKSQYLKANNSELLDETKKLLEEYNQFNVGKIELNSKVELTKYYQNEIYVLNLLSWLIRLIGVILIIVGFTFWYLKVQKPNDEILMKKASANSQSEENE